MVTGEGWRFTKSYHTSVNKQLFFPITIWQMLPENTVMDKQAKEQVLPAGYQAPK